MSGLGLRFHYIHYEYYQTVYCSDSFLRNTRTTEVIQIICRKRIISRGGFKADSLLAVLGHITRKASSHLPSPPSPPVPSPPLPSSLSSLLPPLP